MSDKILNAVLVLLSLYFAITAINFYFNSEAAFSGLPSYYGAYNSHFLKDAGISFGCSGIMLALGVFNRPLRHIFVFCGALFVVLHGLFHVSMIFGGMVPGEYYGLEFGAVIIPALITLAAAVVSYRMRSSD